MELQHFSHQHALTFNEEPSHERENVYCSGCGELVSGPSFGCVQCGFYLDKQCAEAPPEMNHPFHRDHSLDLLTRHPYNDRCPCSFCGKTCENFVYHCSCHLNLHIKCALFSRNIAEKRNAEFQHISRIDPSIATVNCIEELKTAECFACKKPLLDSVYFSPDCGFHLHAKCADLPAQINHLCHQEHPLILQFNKQMFFCEICQEIQGTHYLGLIYSCSLCKFAFHIQCAKIPTKINHPSHRKHPLVLQHVEECLPCQICQQTTQLDHVVYFCSICKFVLHSRCVSSPPVIKDKLHNEFILVQRPVSFCDACGTLGNYVPYYCSASNLVVHKKCISLPRIIKFYRHQHSLSHTYFLEQHEQEMWECRYCYEEVNTEHGSYFCSKCNFIFHVNCATELTSEYYEVDSIETEETMDSDERLDLREIVAATWIKHAWHQHNLTLNGDVRDYKQCDGCLLPIVTSFYCCSQCDFFLHKSCAELPVKKHMWFHFHQKPLRLREGIFKCDICDYQTSGFGYTCVEYESHYCLRCALVPDITRCEGHGHNLYWYKDFGSKLSCNACGDPAELGFKCKSCDFVLHDQCIMLPLTARHRSDVHPFKLTYHDDNDYSESQYCDICENKRNPKLWFYHCSDCNTSAHPECVLGKYSFIKPGTIYTKGDHPHPLTFVRKVDLFPECLACGKYCIDLSLECKTSGCNYIVHWECIKP